MRAQSTTTVDPYYTHTELLPIPNMPVNKLPISTYQSVCYCKLQVVQSTQTWDWQNDRTITWTKNNVTVYAKEENDGTKNTNRTSRTPTYLAVRRCTRSGTQGERKKEIIMRERWQRIEHQLKNYQRNTNITWCYQPKPQMSMSEHLEASHEVSRHILKGTGLLTSY